MPWPSPRKAWPPWTQSPPSWTPWTQYNCVSADLKDNSGTLWYTSSVELAQTCKAVSPDALDAAALAELIREKGFIPAARIYALQDDIASHSSYDTSYLYLDQAGVTWLDRAADKGGKSWLNPYMPAAVDYLADLSEEIAGAGFERIFVCGLQYPDTKYLDEMGFGPNKDAMTAVEALQNVLDRMTSAAASTPVPPAPVSHARPKPPGRRKRRQRGALAAGRKSAQSSRHTNAATKTAREI